MTHAPLARSIHALFAAAAAAGLVACGSSDGGIPDAGVYGSVDGDMGGHIDGPIQGPFDAMSLDDAGKTSTCPALKAYAKCNTSDPCADIEAKDCIAFDGIYSTAGRMALSSCYGASGSCSADGGGSVTGCLYAAGLAATADTAQKKLATAFCAACPDGSACADNFYGDAPDDAGNVGLGATLGLALVNDSTIAAIQSMCISGLKGGADDCGFAFAQCAGPIIDPGQCSGIMMSTGDAGADADPGGA
jgi:hypothetical protein